VLVVSGVTLAFLRAGTARPDARLEHGSGDRRIELGLAREDPSGRRADVAAVQARPDAAHERRQLRLTQAGVRAGDTGLRAVEARLDALDQRTLRQGRRSRMGLEHLRCVRHHPSPRRPPDPRRSADDLFLAG
jgi:hypothetical protein